MALARSLAVGLVGLRGPPRRGRGRHLHRAARLRPRRAARRLAARGQGPGAGRRGELRVPAAPAADHRQPLTGDAAQDGHAASTSPSPWPCSPRPACCRRRPRRRRSHLGELGLDGSVRAVRRGAARGAGRGPGRRPPGRGPRGQRRGGRPGPRRRGARRPLAGRARRGLPGRPRRWTCPDRAADLHAAGTAPSRRASPTWPTWWASPRRGSAWRSPRPAPTTC